MKLSKKSGALVAAACLCVGFLAVAFFRSAGPPAPSLPAGAASLPAEPSFRKAPPFSSDISDWDTRIAASQPDDFPALARQALAISDPASRTDVLSRLVRTWIDSDLRGFLDFINESEVDETDDDVWAALAPALMDSLPKVGDRAASSLLLRQVIERLLVNYASVEPRKALEWARQWLFDRELEMAAVDIAPELARTSPDEGLELALSIHSAGRRLEALAGVGSVLGELDPDLAAKKASQLKNPAESAFMMGSVLDAMAESRPLDAAKEFGTYRQKLEADFDAQLAADRAQLGTRAEEEFEGLTPEEARKVIRSSPNLDYLANAIGKIASSWARSDRDGALQWARSLPEGRQRTGALASVYDEWAQSSPPQAFSDYRREGISRPEISEKIFATWAGSDPSAATAALSQVPKPERMRSIEAIAQGWAENDLEPARIWATQLPDPKERDAAALIIASAAAYEDPEFAWQAALGISDSQKRRDALEEAFQSLAMKDSQTARAAISRATLTPEQRSDFTSILESMDD